VRRQEFHFKYGRLSYGGILRRSRHGRGTRPLSPKDPIHIVFKVNKKALPRGLRHPSTFLTLNRVNRRYAKRFRVKIEMMAVEKDHVHILAHANSRKQFQAYFRALAGQFAQIVTGTFRKRHRGPRIWKYRPYTRVVKGERDRRAVRNYIKLNEAEASGKIPYRKERTRGLSPEEISRLWDTS
jgi:putative transposase